MHPVRRALLIAVLAGAVSACGKSPELRVLETFEVGREVYVRSLAIDPQQQALWVGTSLGVHEVDLVTRNTRDTYTREQGLANEYVFAIFIDKEGNKWFGTNGGGASRLGQGEWKTFFPMHGLADYWVYAFNQQQDGTLWIGTWAGANRYNPKTGAWTTYFKELINEWVYAVAVDRRQQVWLGTEGGISMYDGRTWRAWTHADGVGAPNDAQLPVSENTGLGTRARHDLNIMTNGRETYNPNYILCLMVDRQDQVWAGTWGGGVSRFDGKKWRNYTMDDGLAGNIVFSMTQATDGSYWFGTQRGVSRFDGRHWQSFGREQGLIDNPIYSVAAAPNGDVWVGAKGGVARIGL